MIYKVGDKVRIKDEAWYNKNKNKDKNGNIVFSSKLSRFSWCENIQTVFTKDMAKFCGKVVTIETVWSVNYSIKEGSNSDYFTDEMIECLVERNGKLYPYKIGDRVRIKGTNKLATITDLKCNSFGNLSYYIKIDNDKDISIDYPTDLLLPYDNMVEEVAEDGDAVKYNEGDKVRIKSKEWYDNNKDEDGNVHLFGKFGWIFTEKDSKWCGKVVTIVSKGITSYVIEEDNCEGYWTDEMIECKVEEETKPQYEDEIVGYSTPKYLVRPSGYEFRDENGNLINATKIVLEKKKKEYPRTYKECCRVLGVSEFEYNHTGTNVWYRHKLMATLDKLMLCRDAYWKMAGEEMGLGKSWEPDWEDEEWSDMYYISYDGKSLEKEKGFPCVNIILIFPTAEMRDAFYENFKEEIEKCKELL